MACIRVALAIATFTSVCRGLDILAEPYCDDAVRIRIAPPGQTVKKALVGALDEEPPCESSYGAVVVNTTSDSTTTTNGNLKVTVDDAAGTIAVERVSDGTVLLEGKLPTFVRILVLSTPAYPPSNV